MGVVGGCHGDAGLPCQLDELRQHRVVLFQTVILQFDVVVSLPKEVPIPQCHLLGTLIVSRQNRLGHLAGKTGGHADKPFVVLFQQLLIHTGLGIKAFHEGGGDHLDQVFVTGLVFAQQDQMVVAVDLVHLVKASAGRHIDFAADNGLDARLFCRLVELQAAVHDAVVGAGNGGLSALLYPVHQLVDAAGSVQEAVLRMDMQVDKVPALPVIFADLAHGVTSCSRRLRRLSAAASSFFIR